MEHATTQPLENPPMHGAEVYLFLDFDGVLHDDPEDGQELVHPFEHLPAFEQVLREADPGGCVKIVISSAWRESESLATMKAFFSDDVALRIVDITPILPVLDMGWAGLMTRGHRESEIQAWLAQHAPKASWFAIDDKKEGFKAPYTQVVLVTPHDEDGRGLDEYSLREVFWAIKDRLDLPLTSPKANRFRP